MRPRSDLPIEGELPPLAGATSWLNSPALTPAMLRGKVVLIDFWTYSCINCLRALPYVKAWYQKYRNHGLVVIGVHAPEFAFEKDLGNVRHAVSELGVTYPVALDNDYAIWQGFNNQYWPAHYFIDASRPHPRPPLRRGQLRGIRADHPPFVEGCGPHRAPARGSRIRARRGRAGAGR